MSVQDQHFSAMPQRRTPGLMPMIVPMVVGLVVGATATWALLVGGLDRATPWVDGFLHLVLPGLGVAAAALVIVVPLAWWAMRRFVKGAQGTLEQVVTEVTATARVVSERDAPAAAGYAERAVREALAWYGPVAARRWVVQTALALLVTFGGLIGTALLFRQTLLLGEQNQKLGEQTVLLGHQTELLRDQNTKLEKQTGLLDEQTKLLRDQNAKLDLQTVTAEAQRRAGLSAELFSILQTVSLLEAGSSGTEPKVEQRLPRGLTARIVAFSHAATPYLTVEIQGIGEARTPRLADRAFSPERGQLLTGLVLAGVNVPGLQGATFEAADLSGANLSGATLSGAILFGANLSGADLSKANLSEASLIEPTLSRANLSEADLSGAKVGERFEPPPGWQLYSDESGVRRLRRADMPTTPQTSSPATSQTPP